MKEEASCRRASLGVMAEALPNKVLLKRVLQLYEKNVSKKRIKILSTCHVLTWSMVCWIASSVTAAPLGSTPVAVERRADRGLTPADSVGAEDRAVGVAVPDLPCSPDPLGGGVDCCEIIVQGIFTALLKHVALKTWVLVVVAK